MVPVAICLLICMFNGSVPIMIVEGLDSTASSSEGAASQPEVVAFDMPVTSPCTKNALLACNV